MLAVCLCWCPAVILYNYLTYFFLLAALILLYYGVVGAGGRYCKLFLAAAGALLGVNVFVRFSNLAETAFIVFVWYGVWLRRKEEIHPVIRAMKDTLWCLSGYVAGFLSLLLIVCGNYGLEQYLVMLQGMSQVESSTSRYSISGMLLGPWMDYAQGMKWLAVLLLYMAAGVILFSVLKGKLVVLKKIGFLGGMILLYRYYWGHAMFSFNYYSYGAMFWPVIVVLLLAIFVCLHRLLGRRNTETEKLLTALVFLVILITPLGSNNRSYPVMNNLFLVLPCVLYWGYEEIRKYSFAVKSTFCVWMLFFMVQIIGFGMTFTFGDGAPDQKRDAKIENNGILRGMVTTSKKARILEELTA